MPTVLDEGALQPQSGVLLATSVVTAQAAVPLAALPDTALAQAKKGKRAAPATGRVAEVLVVTDSGGRDYALAYATFALGLGAPAAKSALRVADSWKKLVAILQQYRRIGILVLHFHGTPGSLIVGGTNRSLTTFAADLGKKAPEVTTRVEFESCSVGEGVDEIVPLAKALRAPELYAWNHFSINTKVEIRVKKGNTADQIKAALANYLPQYLLPGTPTPERLAARPGSHVLFAVWFRSDLNEEPLPAKPTGGLDTREKTFKPRGSSTDRTVTHGAAAKLAEDYVSTPVLPLERVVLVP